MIKIYSMNWKVNVEAGGIIENPNCQAWIVVGAQLNKTHFDLIPDEVELLRTLTRLIETRLAIDICRSVEPPEATAAKAGGL